jgi:hypothetical protein
MDYRKVERVLGREILKEAIVEADRYLNGFHKLNAVGVEVSNIRVRKDRIVVNIKHHFYEDGHSEFFKDMEFSGKDFSRFLFSFCVKRIEKDIKEKIEEMETVLEQSL